jgi:2-polyprenyl-3-methyl-5-hydroxy-6-metoxy-1,4-benzoquinol methylase
MTRQAIRFIDQQDIQRLVQTYADAVISPSEQDEMAIPTYLHPNPLIRWLFRKRYEIIFNILLKHKASRTNVLEFGCGIGLFLPSLYLLSKQVYAIDLFPQVAQGLAQELGISVTFLKSLDEIPNHSLETIIAADAMEHVEDAQALTNKFWEKLQAGGWLIVSGPTENMLYQVGRWLAGFSGKGDYHHTTIIQLEKMVQASHFQKIEKHSLPLPPPFCLFEIIAFQKQDVLETRSIEQQG